MAWPVHPGRRPDRGGHAARGMRQRRGRRHDQRRRGHARRRWHVQLPAPGQPGLHRAGQRPGVRGHAGRPPGLPGPRQVRHERQGRDGGRRGPRRVVGDHRLPDLDLHAQAGRHVPGSREPRGQGAGLRRLVELRHRPGQPVLRVLHPGSHRGLRRRRLPGRHQAGPHRRQGDRRLHARGQAALPVRRVPADARPHRRRRVAGRLRQGDRRQEVRPEARRYWAVHGRVVEEQPEHHAGQEPGLLGHERGCRPVHRHHQHADHHLRADRVARVPEGHHRLHRGAAGPGRCRGEQA